MSERAEKRLAFASDIALILVFTGVFLAVIWKAVVDIQISGDEVVARMVIGFISGMFYGVVTQWAIIRLVRWRVARKA